jgi:hypothetical protein
LASRDRIRLNTGMRTFPVGAILLGCLATSSFYAAAPADTYGEVRVVSSPPKDASNAHYVSNRAPLRPSPFAKLPIGQVVPQGWLREMLRLEADGMSGHLSEISKWCKLENSAWASKDGRGENPWEELPYWLKGYGDLGYVLNDPRITAEAKRWINGILSSQEPGGWFGPQDLKGRLGKDRPDLWPHMLALNVLQSYQEATGDERVIPFMTKFFRWELDYPDELFLSGYWPKLRGGDNLESVYWLYNRTGDAWLLDLAKKIHKHTGQTEDRRSGGWDFDKLPDHHGVNLTQGFREPATFWLQSGDEQHLRRTYRHYDDMMDQFGQVPGGMFAADENARPDNRDPRGGAETCSMVEFLHSFELLTRFTGDPVWSDRVEDVAFNSLTAAQTPDLKGLHYLTCPNQVRLDKEDKSPAVQNHGQMFSYSPFERYRCCQHNVAHGWPYFTEESWLATSDNGLCASLLAPTEVTAKVGAGEGTTVKVVEETSYPNDDTISFRISADKPVKFPLYLRLPGWCGAPELKVNDQATTIAGARQAGRPAYAAIDREWKDGDRVTLRLPMNVSIRTWAKNKNAVSIDRGPLSYSLQIGESWKVYDEQGQWKHVEVSATTPWNYGLVLDASDAAKSIQAVPLKWAESPINPLGRYSFVLRVKAKKIPNWTTDADGVIRPLQQSPVRSDQPEETVTLIPMGAARLRITVFPTIGDGPDARQWALPSKATASHVGPRDTLDALNDGQYDNGFNDDKSNIGYVPRFTWWDHKGSEEWVQYDYARPVRLSSVRVYWFDDGKATKNLAKGECRVPASWSLQYKDAQGEWKPVDNAQGLPAKKDQFDDMTFKTVETTSLRLVAKLQPNFSAGIIEWIAE